MRRLNQKTNHNNILETILLLKKDQIKMAFNDKCEIRIENNKYYKKKNQKENEAQKPLQAYNDHYNQESPEEKESRFSLLFGNCRIIFKL